MGQQSYATTCIIYLKTPLIIFCDESSFEEQSEQRRFQQLLNLEKLGDRKPTELLRIMHHILGENAETMNEYILKGLFV